MPYYISKVFLGSDQHVELTPDEYRAASAARLQLIHACYIEEKFAYLIDNFFELENDALTNTLANSNHPFLPFEERVQNIHLFNRRIINLLTTCRLYLDHVAHHLKEFGELEDELKSLFTSSTNHAYDNSFAYRLLESLRNYVQHRGLPIKGISRNDAIIDRDNPQLGSELTLSFTLDVQGLIDDPKFKTATATELEQMDVESVDLRPLIREYVGLLASVNETFRDRISQHISQWHDTVKYTLCKFSGGDESRESLLRLEERNENDETIDHVFINHGAFKRRQRLINLYGRMTGVSKRFVTARPPDR